MKALKIFEFGFSRKRVGVLSVLGLCALLGAFCLPAQAQYPYAYWTVLFLPAPQEDPGRFPTISNGFLGSQTKPGHGTPNAVYAANTFVNLDLQATDVIYTSPTDEAPGGPYTCTWTCTPQFSLPSNSDFPIWFPDTSSPSETSGQGTITNLTPPSYSYSTVTTPPNTFPTVEFLYPGTYEFSVTVQDSQGNTCPSTQLQNFYVTAGDQDISGWGSGPNVPPGSGWSSIVGVDGNATQSLQIDDSWYVNTSDFPANRDWVIYQGGPVFLGSGTPIASNFPGTYNGHTYPGTNGWSVTLNTTAGASSLATITAPSGTSYGGPYYMVDGYHNIYPDAANTVTFYVVNSVGCTSMPAAPSISAGDGLSQSDIQVGITPASETSCNYYYTDTDDSNYGGFLANRKRSQEEVE